MKASPDGDAMAIAPKCFVYMSDDTKLCQLFEKVSLAFRLSCVSACDNAHTVLPYTFNVS